MRTHQTKIALAAIVLLLGACASAPQGRDPASAPPGGSIGPERAQRLSESINLQGFPPEYQQGHTDGCAAVGIVPVPKPAGEPLYVQGWRDGHRFCTRRASGAAK